MISATIQTQAFILWQLYSERISLQMESATGKRFTFQNIYS